MQVYKYESAGPGSGVWVEITGHSLRFCPDRRKDKTLPFTDIDSVRYFTTESPHRTDYSLLIRGRDMAIELNYVCLKALQDPFRNRDFNRAISAVLDAIAKARPDIAVTSGRSPIARWLVFLCFLIPAAAGLGMGAVLVSEPDALGFAIPAFLIGGISLVSAIRAHPWRQPMRMAAADLAALFAEDASAPSN